MLVLEIKVIKEAQAARIYFKDLYGKQFKRGRYNDIINSGVKLWVFYT